MRSSWIMGRLIGRLCRKGLGLASMVALVLLLPAVAANAEENTLSKETTACLKCHDKEDLTKTLENKETLSLHVSTSAFIESMHGKTDCEDCHSGLDAKTHGKEKASIASKREYSLSLQGSCRECHKKDFAKYEDSLHAALVKEGSKEGRKDAPLCADCHNQHTLRSVKIIGPIAATPCAKCHEKIFEAYSKDVHGLERVAKGKSAPICANCHQTHDVKAASLGDGIKEACLECHKEAVKEHKDWLPNAALHFEAISCPVCHAPDAQRRVNLRLYDEVAKKQISEKAGDPLFKKRTDAADLKETGLNELALYNLLKEFNKDGQGHVVLRGRLEVSSGVEAHQLADKSKAIKDCNVCHQAGAQPFQSVVLTIASPDGRPLRHAVQKDILNSMLATQSVKGFYAVGSTRIGLLDNLLIVVFLAGVGGPLVHIVIKWLFRKERRKNGAAAHADSQAQPGDRRADDASK